MKTKHNNKIDNYRGILVNYRGIAAENYSKQKEWIQFVYGDQYKDEIKEKLEAIGHAPIAFNYIISSVQQGKAFLSANHPSFSVVGRDDNDTKKGKMFADFLRYLWYISDGDIQYRQFIDSYYIAGLGHFHVYEDIDDDYGRGEIKFRYESNWNIYVDPSSKHPMYDDAKDIFVTKIMTGEEFVNNFPDFKNKLKQASNTTESNIPSSDISGDSVLFSDDYGNYEAEEYEFVTRYSKFREPYYHFLDITTQSEEVFSVKDWENEISKTIVYFILYNDEYILFNDSVKFMAQVDSMKMQNLMFEYDASSYNDMVERGVFQIYKYNETRINMFCMIGDIFMFERTLPISYYPVIPAFAIHNNTPFPLSDVAIAYPVQEFINKIFSLIVAHTQATTTLKLLIPKGSVDDISEIEKKWMMPWAAIEVDMSYGEPKIAQAPPLNSAILSLLQMAKHLIEYQFGIFEAQMGNSAVAPNTYKGTIAIDEFGQRRIKAKLQVIESSLTRLGQVILNWGQSFYTDHKVFRVVQPNNTMVEGEINGIKYDDFSEAISTYNDITSSRYDVVVLSGSTLPINRYAEWETYKEAYSAGLIDQEEALKKTEIFDKDGVMERMSVINNLNAQLEQATKEIENLKGDLQTAEREYVHSNKRIEIEKFKTKLNEIVANLKKDEKIAEKSIEFNVNEILNSLQMEAEKLNVTEEQKER